MTQASVTPFIDILVTVKPSSVPGQYDVTTEPVEPVVTEPDTVLSYQIFDSAGHDIVFTGMSVTPHHNNQFSTPSISVSGKLMTFSDANTVPMILNINLKFKTKEGHEFGHDPQVQNDPRPQ